MKKKVILLTLLSSLTLCTSITSCNDGGANGGGEQAGFGNKIVEDETTNFLNDNYRNYYEIFVGSYYDSNGDGMGDLNGVTKKLDYIKDAGFNGIWLMPIFESPSYHKYDVKDYYKIDPQYGTMDDFKNLLKEAHKRDIKIIIDMVVNHASKQNEIFKKSCAAYAKHKSGKQLTKEEDELRTYFSYSDTWNNGINSFHMAPGYDFYYEGNFSPEMPEWNFDSQYAKNYLQDVYKYYIDMGVDGFRLDAVKYFELGNTERNVELLNELADYCKSLNPNFYLVGECWGPLGEIAKYYKSNIDSFFNFDIATTNINYSPIFSSLNFQGKNKTVLLDSMIESQDMVGKHIAAPFLDNHDMNRYAVSNVKKTKFYYGLLAMYTGSTFAYYGDEIGINGAIRSINNYNYDEDVRRHMYWSETNKTGTCNDPARADKTPYIHEAVDVQMKDFNSIFNYYKKANLLRNKFPTLTHGKVLNNSIVKKDNPIALINKEYNGDKLGVLINFDTKNHNNCNISKFGYSEVVGTLAVDNNFYIGNLGNKNISIPPYGIAIVK